MLDSQVHAASCLELDKRRESTLLVVETARAREAVVETAEAREVVVESAGVREAVVGQSVAVVNKSLSSYLTFRKCGKEIRR